MRPSAALWRALGQAELKRGDATAAIAAFDEALRRDPTDGETHYNQGVALQTARHPRRLHAPTSGRWRFGPISTPPISIWA